MAGTEDQVDRVVCGQEPLCLPVDLSLPNSFSPLRVDRYDPSMALFNPLWSRWSASGASVLIGLM